MKVIFKRDYAKIGKKFQVKNVADGYALNFLIPNGYAVMATPQAEKELAQMIAQAESDKKVQNALLDKNLKAIAESKIEIRASANEKGHLFSSIHKEQIVEELKNQLHIDITQDFVHLDKPLKEIGEHKIKIGNSDKQGVLTLVIGTLQKPN
ncbi:MAG TPA: 50S ribosomal protein L9 [Candidatus Nanoarchaeia archaeon]|nr:50S ribosomal protein L9 [Candidatus Nanoarchaeia archaeon]